MKMHTNGEIDNSFIESNWSEACGSANLLALAMKRERCITHRNDKTRSWALFDLADNQ